MGARWTKGSNMEANIVLLPGDGVGPEVVAAAVSVLDAVSKAGGHHFTYQEELIGGTSIDRCGVALTDEVLETCKRSDAVLLGAVGGPKWDDPSAAIRPEQGLLALRKGLGVFANLRPVKVYSALLNASPVKAERLVGVDMVLMRELSSGLYYGEPRKREVVGEHIRAVDTLEYWDHEIERIARLAFELSRGRRKKVTSVDKANVLESSRLWRQVVTHVGQDYPDIALDHILVDTAAMRLVSSPAAFDVIVTENMFGDILTDEASVLSGSMGLLPSASLGVDGPGLYEPIHGSAPDIAGKGISNPVGTILSAAMLLRYSLKMETESRAVEEAVDATLQGGSLTYDLGGSLSTEEMTLEIIRHIQL